MSHVVRTRLPNGLTVLCEPSHFAPVIALQAWVQVGAADETAAQAGLAHLHEHMLFKGTKKRRVGELARDIEAAGGEINAWTSFDQTVYHVILAAVDAATGLDVLSDAVCNSVFDPQELQRESEVVVEEILRAQDSPARRLSNALFELAYTQHPYRLPVLGTAQSVRSFDRPGILEFYHAHYRPENVTVVAVGDFEPAHLLHQIEDTFGLWQPHAQAGPKLPRRKRAVEPAQTELRVRLLSEDIKEARLALAWHGPSMVDDDLAAVDLMATILGHGESSRLFDVVRRREGMCNDVSAYAYTPQDAGLLMVSASLGAQDLPRALQLMAQEVFALRTDLVRPAELQKARTLILSEQAYARETVQGQARKLGLFEASAGDYAFEQSYLAAIKAATAQDVQAVACKYLHATPSVVVQQPQDAAGLQKTAVRDIVQGAFAQAQAATKKRSRGTRGPLGVDKVVLDSGATLLVCAEDSPVINLRAVALGGQRWEPAGQAGLGYLFSCVWGTATEHLQPQALAQRVAELAGSLAGFSGRNTCGMSAEFVADQGEAALNLFIEVLTQPVFLTSQLERERQVTLERIKSRDDSPGMVAFDLFSRTLHPTHSYGQRMYGTEASIAAITPQALLAHRQTFLQPDKLVISVVGGVDAHRVIDLFNAALVGTPSAALPTPSPMDPVPRHMAPQRLHLARKQSHVIIGGRGTCLNHVDRFGLEVLSTLLSGQSGRLFLDLRDRQSLAYSVSSSALEGLDPGHFMVHIGTSPDKVAQACAGVYGHLDALLHTPVSDDELRRAQRYLIGTHAIDLQRGGSRAMAMALNERYGLAYDEHTRYAAAISKVDVSTLQKLAQKYLQRDNLIEVVVGPQDAAHA
jgi:zinc protease